ncbi:hypothetical protein GCM10007269_36450 [Microbacterium murale]|uniref:Uncharacterized protein n=1 Tax=Microbacterium murale TaxID=1081040 RepID=A0ABQ1S5V8_9MICO|nr:hypothetical protein GCM10007269_36450 [Microbacterium murale]
MHGIRRRNRKVGIELPEEVVTAPERLVEGGLFLFYCCLARDLVLVGQGGDVVQGH